MKTFGLMAAIGKIELDNFRERSTLGKRGTAKQVLGNTTYTGTWIYGKYRHVSTEDGKKVYDQPRDTWVEIPIPQVIDDETWERAQKLKETA